MSVDFTAKFVYGYTLSHEEYEEIWVPYWKAQDKYDEIEDYICYIDAYSDSSDVAFGIELVSTDYHCELSLQEVNEVANKYQAKLLDIWRQAMPQRKDRYPKFMLILHQW